MAKSITHHEAIRQAITRHTQRQLQRPAEELRAELEQSEKEIREGWLGISDFLDEQGHPMEETTPPTQISANEFRELLAKVNAPAEFVEEELVRWRSRGLITLEPDDLLLAFLTKEAEKLGRDYWDDVYDSAPDMALAALQRGIEIAETMHTQGGLDPKPAVIAFEQALADYDALVSKSYTLAGHHTGHGVGKVAPHSVRHAHAEKVRAARGKLVALTAALVLAAEKDKPC